MAGIIGQITAQARVRRLKKRISADKCNYILPPFSAQGYLLSTGYWGWESEQCDCNSSCRFDASIHNTYLRNKIRISEKQKKEEEEREIKRELELAQEVSSLDNDEMSAQVDRRSWPAPPQTAPGSAACSWCGTS